jgi:predicted Rossmann fold nucleotide-binding protein DprA/Smf involved in DNA uptake
MRVLIVSAQGEEEIHRARKNLGYEQLVLVVPESKSEALAQVAPQGAQLVNVPEHEFLACLEAFEGVLRAHAKDEVRVAVDGGTTAMSGAAFLACIAQGVEAWFTYNKVVRLPVLRARPVERRFGEEQAAVLAALDERMPLDELAKRTGLAPAQAQRALLSLRKEQAVAAGADWAEPTPLGDYYRRALKPK